MARVAGTELALTIRGDTAATWGRIVQVMDAAKAARVKNVSALVKTPGASNLRHLFRPTANER